MFAVMRSNFLLQEPSPTPLCTAARHGTISNL
jgi:hypothetical protein